jgi:hypothetical protein
MIIGIEINRDSMSSEKAVLYRPITDLHVLDN